MLLKCQNILEIVQVMNANMINSILPINRPRDKEMETISIISTWKLEILQELLINPIKEFLVMQLMLFWFLRKGFLIFKKIFIQEFIPNLIIRNVIKHLKGVIWIANFEECAEDKIFMEMIYFQRYQKRGIVLPQNAIISHWYRRLTQSILLFHFNTVTYSHFQYQHKANMNKEGCF